MVRYGLLFAALVVAGTPAVSSASVAGRSFAVGFITTDGEFDGEIGFLADTNGGPFTEAGDAGVDVVGGGDATGTYEAGPPVGGTSTDFTIQAVSDEDDYRTNLSGTVTEPRFRFGTAKIRGTGFTTDGVIFFFSGEEI
jgi:hypothetical protein